MINDNKQFSHEVIKVLEEARTENIGNVVIPMGDVFADGDRHTIVRVLTSKGLVTVVQHNGDITVKQRLPRGDDEQDIGVGTIFNATEHKNIGMYLEDIWDQLS